MSQIILKKDILNKLTSNGPLFGAIATSLNIAPVSLPRLIYKNDKKLTQAGVLKLIKDHLGVENESDLLDVVPDSESNNNIHNPQMQTAN